MKFQAFIEATAQKFGNEGDQKEKKIKEVKEKQPGSEKHQGVGYVLPQSSPPYPSANSKPSIKDYSYITFSR